MSFGKQQEDIRSIVSYRKRVIEVVRHYDVNQKTEISDRTGLAWPTVRYQIEKLQSQAIVERGTDGKYNLNPKIAFFAGISIGRKHTRLLIVDFQFKMVPFDKLFQQESVSEKTKKLFLETCGGNLSADGDYVSFPSPKNLLRATGMVDRFMDLIVALIKDGVPIYGVGLSLPVAFDKESGRTFGTVMMSGISIDDLIYQDKLLFFRERNIPLVAEHGAKLVAIAEKEYLYLRQDPNMSKGHIAVVYLGSDIGVGLILNHQLHRGSGGMSGTIGHLPNIPAMAPEITDTYFMSLTPVAAVDTLEITDADAPVMCDVCQKDNCLTARLKQCGAYDIISEGSGELSNEAMWGLFVYLGRIIGTLTVLDLDLIILSGKAATLDPDAKIWRNLNILLMEYSESHTSRSTRIIKTPVLIPHTAVGAAINAYYAWVDDEPKQPEPYEKINTSPVVKWLDFEQGS
ncbi:MAG: ROK family protein [Candidatus Nomurabacteria bacterium]|nr:ROK family protein [Candidatus Nomurabacteria bacterium]